MVRLGMGPEDPDGKTSIIRPGTMLNIGNSDKEL